MKFIKQNIIFDVGAFDGCDGLMLAKKNKNFFVYAFEANPDLCKIIKKNKILLEKRIGKKISNYKILNFAVSDLNNANKYFYIAKNPTVSSLNKFSKNFKKTWKGYDNMFQVSKTIKVRTITLSKFCIDNNIKKIAFLHCDTQGNDLKVFKGLGNYRKVLNQGVMECAVNQYRSLYQGNHTLQQTKKVLFKNGFEIHRIEEIEGTQGNEFNVFYARKKLKDKSINLNYNTRYLRRVFQNRTYLKDDIKDFILRFCNRFLN